MTDVPSTPVSRPEEESTGRGLMIAGLVLGIASILFGWIIPLVGVVAGVIGIILSPIGIKRAKRWHQKHTIGVSGLILSIVGLVWSIIWWIGYAGAMSQDSIAY